jgi:hypothetical protein
MKNITLVTTAKIISKIFILVCQKLELNLNLQKNDENIKSSDILIIDDNLFNSKNIIRYKSLSNNISIIAKEKIYEYEEFNIIKKPFLPSLLSESLLKILDKSNINLQKENIKEDNESINNLVDFVDSLEDEKSDFDSSDEDIYIHQKDLGHGGVLDKEELDILHNMINDSNEEIQQEKVKINNSSNNDWLELSEIIDKAIDDAQAVDIDNELVLILNDYSMSELSPLLNKLNQYSVDILSSGKELTLKIRLEKKYV